MLLEVQTLKTYFTTLRGYVRAVDGISFHVDEGKAMGLAGESGCGKTTCALSILKILPSNGKILGGKIIFKDKDLVKFTEEEMRKNVLWKRISLVFQGAINAFNPVYKVGNQIVEAILTNETGISKKEAWERSRRLFEMVGIEPSRLKHYAHEYSGGMKQRAMIAMALACKPELLIADEPGTALDVIVQAQVLRLIKGLKEKLNLAMIMISHDLSIIGETCDSVAIMYAGKIVEYGDVTIVFKESLHPYTKGLMKAFPSIKEARRRMSSIPGSPPDLLAPPPGCRFHPRCSYAMDICRKEEPRFLNVDGKHYVACHLVSMG